MNSRRNGAGTQGWLATWDQTIAAARRQNVDESECPADEWGAAAGPAPQSEGILSQHGWDTDRDAGPMTAGRFPG
jgi:hypothetical protein